MRSMVRLTGGIVSDGHIYLSDAEREKLPYVTGVAVAPAPEGGEVGLGTRRRGRDERVFRVHLFGRRQQAISIDAVVAAIKYGIIPRDAIEALLAAAGSQAQSIAAGRERMAALAAERADRSERSRRRHESA